MIIFANQVGATLLKVPFPLLCSLLHAGKFERIQQVLTSQMLAKFGLLYKIMVL